MVSFAQEEDSAYNEGRIAFLNYNYKVALSKFEAASDSFLKKNKVKNYLKAQLYLSNIAIYKNDYSSALKIINSSIEKYRLSGVSNDSLQGELINTKALIYRLNGQATEALKISDMILSRQLKTPAIQKYNLIKTYVVRSRILIAVSKYNEAIRSINKGLLMIDDTTVPLLEAELLNNMGTAYLLKDEYSKAQQFYDKAYTLKLRYNANLYDLAITAFNIGVIHEAQGDYDNAIEFYKKSAHYDLKNQGEEIGFISDIYMAISGIYREKNDIAKAEEYIEKSLKKSISIFGPDHLNVANVYTWYVRFLKLTGREEESLVHDKKALAIKESSYGVYNRFPIQNLRSIADTYTMIQDYKQANDYYVEALRRIQKMNSKVQEAECYIGIGNMYTKQKKYSNAIDSYSRAFINFSEHFHKNHRFALEAELLKAKALFQNKDFKLAKRIIKRHLDLNDQGQHNFPTLVSEGIHIENRIALLNYQDSREMNFLKGVYKNLDLMIRNTQEVKKEFTTQASRINFDKNSSSYFEKAIDICYKLFKKTNNNEFLEKAFQFSEMNRNSELVKGIRDENFKKMAGIPDTILHQENTVKRKLARIKEKLYKEEQHVKIDSLMSLRLLYGTQLDSLLIDIEKKYPKYYQLKYADQTISISEIQKKHLDKNTSIIEYYVGKEDIYVFVINKDVVDFKKLPITVLVRELVSTYRKQLIEQKNIKESSEKLFSALLKKLNLNENLIFIADDVLNYIPFETLMFKREYLLNKHSISYIGSATLLKTQIENPVRKQKEITWSGFAPKYEEENSFSSNNKEIESISKIMDGMPFFGADANKRNFLKNADKSSILHLAAHATVDHINPMYNSLVFSKDSIRNELTASEIYTLSIPSELVVLSACDTGFGKLQKGEGIMSMSRAFQYAGAKSTVMSLWKVPDKETSIIMQLFYKNLKKGIPKDRALQNAKLKYLSNTKDKLLKHPYYWAGFVVSGNTDPLPSDFSYWCIIILISGFLCVLIFRKRLFQFFK